MTIMKHKGFIELCNEVQEMLDEACNDLSVENFERFKTAVKQMVDAYE